MMDVGLYSSGLHFWLKLWNLRRRRAGGGAHAAYMRRGMCWARRDLPLEAAQGGGGGGLWWCRRLRRCFGGGCAAERRAVKRRWRHIGLFRWILFINYFLACWFSVSPMSEGGFFGGGGGGGGCCRVQSTLWSWELCSCNLSWCEETHLELNEFKNFLTE